MKKYYDTYFVESGGGSEGTEAVAAAEAYANSLGYQSDKEQHTTTPWTEWNLRRDAFIAGVKFNTDRK